jgi:hypothetical protein
MSTVKLSIDDQSNLVLQVEGEPDAAQYRAFIEELLPDIQKMMQEKSDFLKATSNIVVPIFSNDFSKIDISTDKVFGITAKVPLLMSGNKEKILKTVQNFFQDINLTMPIEAMSKITNEDLSIINKFYGNAH